MSRYTRREVEALLPAVWDQEAAYGLQNPYASAPDMPKAATNKAQANTLYAMLADIRTAWGKAGLTNHQKVVLYRSYHYGESDTEIAPIMKSSRQAVTTHRERGVGRLTACLNGDTYVDSYEPDEEEEGAS